MSAGTLIDIAVVYCLCRQVKSEDIGRGVIVLLTIGVLTFLAYVGVIGILDSKSVDDVQIVFMGVYMIIFAATIFFYEIIQLLPCKILDDVYKRNFGFLYTPTGRGCYLMM